MTRDMKTQLGELVPGMELPAVANATQLSEITAGQLIPTYWLEISINGPFA